MQSINEKILRECLECVLNGDRAGAERKFRHNWELTAKTAFSALSESEDFGLEDEEVETVVSDIVNDDMDKEDCFEDCLVKVSELEEKYPTEMTDELVAHFDELKNKIDVLRLAEDEEIENAVDEALVALEDLKADFELAGALEDDVIDLFNAIGECVTTGECPAEDIEVDIEGEVEEPKDLVLEAVEEFDHAEEVDAPEEENPVDAEDGELDFGEEIDPIEDERTTEELVLDAKANTESLSATLEKLQAEVSGEEDEDEPAKVEEDFKPMKLPRGGLRKEEAGVVKKAMAMPKAEKIETTAKLGAVKGVPARQKEIAIKASYFGNAEAKARKWKPIAKNVAK